MTGSGVGSGLVTLGETMGLLTAARVGPLRHARAMDLGIGGSESNVAIGLARLGHRAVWAGRVGDDEIGRLVLATLRGEGVEVSAATIDDERPTGLMLKSHRAAGRLEVVYYRAGSAASRLRPEHIDASVVAGAAVAHLSGITAALGPGPRETVFSVAEAARAEGVLVSVAVNHREALWDEAEAAGVLGDLARRADVVFASEREATLLVGDQDGPEGLADGLAGLTGGDAVVTAGERGAWAVCDGERLREPAAEGEVVDPVGAGDAFTAGYLAGLLSGEAPARRLRMGARCGAFVVASHGDWEGLPTLGELRRDEGPVDDVRR